MGLTEIKNWGQIKDANRLLVTEDNAATNEIEDYTGENYSLSTVPSNFNLISSASGILAGCKVLSDITINSNKLNNLNDAFRGSIANNIVINLSGDTNITLDNCFTGGVFRDINIYSQSSADLELNRGFYSGNYNNIYISGNISDLGSCFFNSTISNNITIISSNLNNISGSFRSADVSGVILNTNNLQICDYAFASSSIKTFSIVDSSSIQTMNGMFDGCRHLRQDFTGFSLAGLTSNNLDTFMREVTLGISNYNKTLVYWNANKTSYPFNNIIINMGENKADNSSGGVNGISAKLDLLNYGWTIIDASS